MLICQTYVKPPPKTTRMTLEYDMIFDEKALSRIGPSVFRVSVASQDVFMELCMEAAIELPAIYWKSVRYKFDNG